MLWFAQARVGLAGFLGKILVALKKLFSSTIFPDFRYMHCIPVPGLCILYIFGDPCQVSIKMFGKKFEFVDNSSQSTHMYVVCIVI